jgi:hypothetical protein
MQFKYYATEEIVSRVPTCRRRSSSVKTFVPIPQDPEAEIYLEATAKDDLSTIFFAGNLKINDLYNVTDPSGNRLPVDMNLTVYDFAR